VYAGPAQAALALERMDPHSSVTFISLACSGATLDVGVYGDYGGVEGPAPGEPATLPPQLDALRALVGTRRVDALLISGGVNNIHFADIIQDCSLLGPLTAWRCDEDPQVLRRLDDDLRVLPDLFEQTAQAIAQETSGSESAAPLNVANVYFTEYPNLLRDADGTFCNSTLGEILPGFEIDSAEARWTESAAFSWLNGTLGMAILQARIDHPSIQWRVIGGIVEAFAGTG
jgi:hypothetical protein